MGARARSQATGLQSSAGAKAHHANAKGRRAARRAALAQPPEVRESGVPSSEWRKPSLSRRRPDDATYYLASNRFLLRSSRFCLKSSRCRVSVTNFNFYSSVLTFFSGNTRLRPPCSSWAPNAAVGLAKVPSPSPQASSMRVARLLALRDSRPRWGQLAAAGSQTSSLTAAAASAGYNALQASTPQPNGLFYTLDSSRSASSSSWLGAPALAASASAGGIVDGSRASRSALRHEQASLSRLALAQPFAQRDNTFLGSGGVDGRAAEAKSPAPWPSRLTSAECSGSLLRGWPLRIKARGLVALLERKGFPPLSTTSHMAGDSAESGSEAGRPLLTSLSLAAHDKVLGGRWPSLRAVAASDRFGARQFSSGSGAAAEGGTGSSASAGAGSADSSVRHERPILVKLGNGQDTDIDVPIKDLWAMRRGGFVNAVATSGRFGTKLVGVSHDDCRVFLLPKVAGKLPTVEEEAGAVELVGSMAFGDLAAQVDPSSSAYFARVQFPAVIERVGEISHISYRGIMCGTCSVCCVCFHSSRQHRCPSYPTSSTSLQRSHNLQAFDLLHLTSWSAHTRRSRHLLSETLLPAALWRCSVSARAWGPCWNVPCPSPAWTPTLQACLHLPWSCCRTWATTRPTAMP